MDFSAVGEDALPDVFDDGGQFVGTDMRVCFVEDGVGCSEEMKELHDALHISAFFGTGEEFTVGEGTGSSFAEAVVRLGIQPLVSVQQCNIFFPFTYFLSSFVNDGFDAMFDEGEGSKESCGTCADDDSLPFGMMYILEDRRLIERDRRIFGDGFALIIRKNSKMHAQISLPCIY